MIVLDTSVVYAFMAEDERQHGRVATWMDAVREPLVTTPLALAEMDHMLDRAGEDAVVALRRSLAAGAYEVRWWDRALSETLDVAERSPWIGLTDASLVALAAHLRTTRIATLDERHFRSLSPLTGEPAFTLLPSDAH